MQSSFLTETRWIYRNHIGRDTKQGRISILHQVIRLKCTNQSNTFQCFHAELPYKGIYLNVKNTSFMHKSVLTKLIVWWMEVDCQLIFSTLSHIVQSSGYKDWDISVIQIDNLQNPTQRFIGFHSRLCFM